MAECNGTVLGVTGRTISQGRVVYDVQAQLETPEGVLAQKLGTFKQELASQAQSLTGQRASFRYEVVVKGQYTNYNLDAIAPEGQLAAVAVGTIPIDQGGGQRGGGGGRGFQKDPETQRQIVKQNVLGTAHRFVGEFYTGLGPDFLEEATAKALAHAQKLYGIVTGGAPAAEPVAAAQPVVVPQAPIVPVATTPAEVAATVPGVQIGVQTPPETASGAGIAWD